MTRWAFPLPFPRSPGAQNPAMSQACSRTGFSGPLCSHRLLVPQPRAGDRQAGQGTAGLRGLQMADHEGMCPPSETCSDGTTELPQLPQPTKRPWAGAAPRGREKAAIYLPATGGEAEDKAGVPCPWSVSRIWQTSENPQHVPATGVRAGGRSCLGAPHEWQLRTPAPCLCPPSRLHPAARHPAQLGPPPLVHSQGAARKMPPSPLARWPLGCSGAGLGGEEDTEVPCPVAALPGSGRPPLPG